MKRFFSPLLFLLFSFFPLAAEDNAGGEVLPPELVEIQGEIDAAVLDRSSEAVSQILKSSKDDENYPKIENFVLEKVRNLISDEDFEFAKNLALAVIENNIENFDAIDLYSFLEKTLSNERAYQRSLDLHRYSGGD